MSGQWAYVIAAYAIGIIGSLGVTGWSWMALKRVENRLDALKRK